VTIRHVKWLPQRGSTASSASSVYTHMHRLLRRTVVCLFRRCQRAPAQCRRQCARAEMV